ncbi:UNVERIFIED_CONTAM: hypothetical protein FKN15_064078 [Acipenser sinensis]
MIMHYLLLTRKRCLYKGEIQGRKHSERSKESGHSSCKGWRSAGSESPQSCPAPESLTVENVQRLERQYEADGRYSVEKAVEKYIRQTHLYCTQQRAKSGRTEQREKEESQGSAGAQSLSGAIPVGIVKASDGSCDAAVGGYVGHQMKTISYRLSAMKSLDQEDMFPAAEEQSDIFAIVSRGQKKVKCRGSVPALGFIGAWCKTAK